MRSSLFATVLCAVALFAIPVANAEVMVTKANYQVAKQDLGKGQRPMAQTPLPGTKTAQMCSICRYGIYWCYMVVAAPAGTSCFCPGQGWGYVSCG